MRHWHTLLSVVLFFVCTPLVTAQNGKQTVPTNLSVTDKTFRNSTEGREFWIAIPPNDKKEQENHRLDIYVTASRNTVVTLEHMGSGLKVSKAVQALQTTTFTTMDNSAFWEWEVQDDERPVPQGIRLTANAPVTVVVFNAKQVTSEGYLALPTNTWDKEYIHCSFWDCNEAREWSGGYLVVAKENGTRVQIDVRGQNEGGKGRTKGGHKIGDKVSVTLQRGEVYMMRGNGKTINQFDLTGTRIVGNKPVGVISFHERTNIPSAPDVTGRDHLCEMIPPVSVWGKTYATLQTETSADAGDLFRVVAAEDNTKFTCEYTDLRTYQTFTWEGFLKKAGDFAEYGNSWPPTPSIRGMAVWTADKPILVMQYSFSSQVSQELGGGGNSLVDPSMTIAVPVEQYTSDAVFQTPASSSFANNYLHLFAIGDSTGAQQDKLKTIAIEDANGTVSKVVDKYPQFVVRRIPNTNIYCAILKLPTGAYKIYGDTPFGATMYGANAFTSYAWPAAIGLTKIDTLDVPDTLTVLDTLKPLLDTIAMAERGNYIITATEKRDQESNATRDSMQIDTGINHIEIDNARSHNYILELITDHDSIHIDPRREFFQFRLRVVDRSQDAFAIYYVTDRAGNVAVDSVQYEPDLVSAGEERRVDGFVLGQNAPNPIEDGGAEIEYTLAYSVPVKIVVYNMQGQEVQTLVNELRGAGTHKVRISKDMLPAGVYIYRLIAGNHMESRQMQIMP